MSATKNDFFENLGRSKAKDDPRFQKLLEQIAAPLGPYENRSFQDLLMAVSDMRRFIAEFSDEVPTMGQTGLFAAAAANALDDRIAGRRASVVVASLMRSIERLRVIMEDEMKAVATGSSGAGSSGGSGSGPQRKLGQR